MQDEHETGKNGVGMERPGADTDAECREPEPGTNPGVSKSPMIRSKLGACAIRVATTSVPLAFEDRWEIADVKMNMIESHVTSQGN